MDTDFKKKMETYRDVGVNLHLSTNTITSIKSMKSEMKRSRIGRKIFIFNFLILLATSLVVPLTAYGAYQVSQALYEKVRNANYSQGQIEELNTQLKDQAFTDDDIAALNDLNVNEYGQTYGPDALGADLIEVISDQGAIGYVYREDLEATRVNMIKEALQNKGGCIIKVYENDGRTETGTFTLTDESDFH